MRVLVTCFEPFGGSRVNPSQAALRLLEESPIARVELISATLPCVDREAERVLLDAVDGASPEAVVCLGESNRAAGLTFERVATNLRDYRIPDNAGTLIRDEPVVPGGPDALFSTLPVKRMVEAVRGAGVPAMVSRDAGAFLCNQVTYALLHRLRETGRGDVPAGFVHLPRLPEQCVERPTSASMSTETVVVGLRAALSALRTALDE